jgi:4-carboxymuconolactone decarboxylase
VYKNAIEALGEIAVVELATLIGYYIMVSINLNVFRVPLPPGEDPPFDEN